MKELLSITIVSILLVFTSCIEDEFTPSEWGIEPELEIYPLATILTPSHRCDTIQVNTNYIDFKVSNVLYWVDVKKIDGEKAIVINATEFTNDDEYREGYITITVKRGKYQVSRDFVVMQFKKDVIYE